MKTLITFAFTSMMIFCHAQDALDCKKDLAYDNTGKFYYKKGDDSKTPYSGNAVCTPKHGMVNKGKLVNGKWNGIVTGYKNEKVIGKANYKNGVYDGLRICYTDQGKTMDSTIYQEGNKVYSYEASHNKEGYLKSQKITNYENNTCEMYSYNTVNKMTYITEIARYNRNKKKDGIQEYFKGESDKPGSLLFYTYQEEKYNNGVIVTKTYFNKGKKYRVDDYADGKLSMQNDINEDGFVTASYPLKGGKKHGTAIVYNEKGDQPTSQQYSRGKLVTNTK